MVTFFIFHLVTPYITPPLCYHLVKLTSPNLCHTLLSKIHSNLLSISVLLAWWSPLDRLCHANLVICFVYTFINHVPIKSRVCSGQAYDAIDSLTNQRFDIDRLRISQSFEMIQFKLYSMLFAICKLLTKTHFPLLPIVNHLYLHYQLNFVQRLHRNNYPNNLITFVQY